MTQAATPLKAPTTTLLTPNLRLAATLAKLYNHNQIAAGHGTWPSLDALPLNAWIARLWQERVCATLDAEYFLLDADQELILWEEIIGDAPESGTVLKLSDLAQQARAAWVMLKHWRADYRSSLFHYNENSRAFQGWAAAFERRCQEAGWLDSASVADLLVVQIERGVVKLPERLVLVNFTEIVPQQVHLLEVCGQRMEVVGLEDNRAGAKALAEWIPAFAGMTPRHEDNSSHGRSPEERSEAGESPRQGFPGLATLLRATSMVHQLRLPDQACEIETMARWAKALRITHPEATIGCIANQLEDKRDEFVAAFLEAFGSTDHFNISAGQPLATYPIIQSALQLLALPTDLAPQPLLSALLQSPFLGEAETEKLARLELDSALRRHNITQLTWPEFFTFSQQRSEEHELTILQRLQTYITLRRHTTTEQSLSFWIERFSALLETLGWPGELSLNSHEYQVVASWQQLLQKTAGLEAILSTLSYAKALHYLTVLMAKTYFQPQTPQAPVQILGQLEGAGLPFDYLWVMGLDDTAWPPQPNPNPFIPHNLQKSLNLPNASAERELGYAQKLMAQFKAAAGTVIFSHADHNDRESLQASPLIAAYPSLDPAALNLAKLNPALEQIFASGKLESLVDIRAPALVNDETLRGGVSLFEMQAACPFKAFAKVRLNAQGLDEPLPGLPARSRGSIIHRALELFWGETKTQELLHVTDPAEIDARLERILGMALHELATFIRPTSLYYGLILVRLKALLHTWLELEKARPPFSILALEQEKVIQLLGLKLRVRIDRIDVLPGGDKLIIDYKTKKRVDTKEWFGDRPLEPQLPLYCIAEPGSVAGLAFAALHTTNTELKGLSQKDLGTEGLQTLTPKTKADSDSWQGQLLAWRTNLTKLLADFGDGHAEVDPKNVDTCHYCDLQTLCRVHEHV